MTGSSAPTLNTILRLQPTGDDTFRAGTPEGAYANGIVFGGQLLGQAALAASQTVTEHRFHSLHAYYVRAGDLSQSIEYGVERVRDGRSFAVRRIVARQRDEDLVHMLASFKVPEDGATHQDTMPDVPPPEALAEDANRAAWEAGVDAMPFEMRRVVPVSGPVPAGTPAVHRIWARAKLPLGNGSDVHSAALAYISDYGLLAATMIPHEMAWNGVNPPSASLDQALWQHRPTDMREWHLLDLASPSASDGRGLGIGSIWRHDGTLVASSAQEGFMRIA